MAIIDRNALLRSATMASGFRLVSEDDIKPGAELFMLDVHYQDRPADGWPTKIRLNDEPIICDEEGTAYVLFRQPQFEQQCFVPKYYFVSAEIEEDHCGPYCTTLYLTKI